MNRIVMQFAGLWLGVSGAVCYAQWNAPTFGNTYRVAYAAQDSDSLPPAFDDVGLAIPAAEQSVMSAEPGMPMSAGPIGYDQGAYGNGAGAGYIGGGYGSEACCEPTNPCTAGLWDGYWSAKRHWCQKDHGCGGCGHHGLLPQLNWAGGCCAHRACFGSGMAGGCCGAGMGGHGLFGGHGHGAGCGCAEEAVGSECGCEPCGDSCCNSGCGHHSLLPQINWVGGCCAHRACMSGGVGGCCGGAGGHGFLGHGHQGGGMMNAGCSSCGN